MLYKRWFSQTIKKVPMTSELGFYARSMVFGLIVFGLIAGYISWLGTPNLLNKAVADTAIVLMGLSMLLSSLCYFWDFVDSKIIYRKYLGLVGFSFMIVHLMLSLEALQKLFLAVTWQQGLMWPALSGLLATIIFSIMAIISNQYMATELGGKVWRSILRTGYVAVMLVWLHVVLLKSARWMTWYENGMKTPPSMSLLVAIFMLVVVGMRLALWISLYRRKAINR